VVIVNRRNFIFLLVLFISLSFAVSGQAKEIVVGVTGDTGRLPDAKSPVKPI
jgi:7-cyano-7-deazaguanine synthase in queuosine biosynthesis